MLQTLYQSNSPAVTATARRRIAITKKIVSGIKMIALVAMPMVVTTTGTPIQTVEITPPRLIATTTTTVNGIRTETTVMENAMPSAAALMTMARRRQRRNVRTHEIRNDQRPTPTVHKNKRIRNVVVSQSRLPIIQVVVILMQVRGMIRNVRLSV